MVTDGSVLTDEITMSGQHDLMFLKTETGLLSSTVIKNTMIILKRYLEVIIKCALVIMSD